jgi:hypothetical protein
VTESLLARTKLLIVKTGIRRCFTLACSMVTEEPNAVSFCEKDYTDTWRKLRSSSAWRARYDREAMVKLMMNLRAKESGQRLERDRRRLF